MLTNKEWKDKIGFVPSPAARAGATPWGVQIAYYFRDTLSHSGLQALLCIKHWEEDFPPPARDVWWLFHRLGEQAPRIIKGWAEKEDEEVEKYLRNFLTSDPPGSLPQRRWRTVKEYAKYLHLEGERLKNTPFYEDPPPIEGVKYINSKAALAASADQFRNCAASYENAIRSGSERIVVVNDRIMVRFDPVNSLLLEAKYKYNEPITAVDKKAVKAVLGLH